MLKIPINTEKYIGALPKGYYHRPPTPHTVSPPRGLHASVRQKHLRLASIQQPPHEQRERSHPCLSPHNGRD
eukprot:342327-Prorocentrum_lima.AAC.1